MAACSDWCTSGFRRAAGYREIVDFGAIFGTRFLPPHFARSSERRAAPFGVVCSVHTRFSGPDALQATRLLSCSLYCAKNARRLAANGLRTKFDLRYKLQGGC